MAIAVVRTILNYKNYDEWSSQIKTYLLAEDLWDVLHQEPPKTEDEEKDESKAWKKKDAKALYAIQNSCGDDTYELIKYKTTAKQAWDTLSKILKKSDEPSDEKEKMSVLQAYPTPTPSDHDTRPEVSMEEGRTGGAGHDKIQETFVKCVKSNDWDNAIELLRQHRQVGGARIPIKWHGTALHCAILNIMSCSVRVIQQLVDLMEKEHLKIRDMLGCTALYYIIKYYPEGVEVAERMVKKNRRLRTIFPLMAKEPLVVVAQGKTKGEGLARYFYSITPHETLQVRHAAQLIQDGFYHNRFDIAWDLIQRYPELAMAKDRNGNIPLVTLASNRFAFKSGSRLSLWENLIYYGIRIKPLPPIDRENPESDHSDQRHISNKKENQWHSVISSGGGEHCRSQGL